MLELGVIKEGGIMCFDMGIVIFAWMLFSSALESIYQQLPGRNGTLIRTSGLWINLMR